MNSLEFLLTVFGIPVCGDGIKNSNEGCDDGNTATSDGCRWQKAFSYSNNNMLIKSLKSNIHGFEEIKFSYQYLN